MKTILIVDDDADIGNMLEETLNQNGYAVIRAYSGTEALLLLKSKEIQKPDLILLDLMLPGLSGEEVLQNIKDVPVIVISAKADTENKVGLLLGGAVDYVTKPFNTKELLARIAAHIRTFEFSAKNTDNLCKDDLCFDDIIIHADTHIVLAGKSEIRLTRTEYAILKLLMQNQPNIISKSVLLDRISEDTPDCTESSLKTHISHLRSKLSKATGKDYIETIWGIGFKMKNG